jgi:2-polyprenyl-3-methyl-5-hydroxy-6-metoxy-1,4-benzoquinol methylase
MENGNHIIECLLCNGSLKEIYNFGATPLANEFSEYKDYISDDKFDLTLVNCKNCNHVQLNYIVNMERLYRDYLYVSSTSSINKKHFQDYAENIIEKYHPKSIIDIGSNDGLFLSFFKEKHILVAGIDPAENIAKEANGNGITTFAEFFNLEFAKKLTSNNVKNPNCKGVYEFKKVDVVTCNHMFAHNPNLENIVMGVLELLNTDGIFVFENSYLLSILDNNLFDLVYHEHMHHHSVTALAKFLRKLGLKIFDVIHFPNQHGGSIRVFTCRNSSKRKVEDSVYEAFEKEKNIVSKLEKFSEKIKQSANVFQNTLSKYSDKKIHCYGYAAKTTTLFYTFKIKSGQIEFCYEDAELKQGKFSPGLHIPIVPVKELYNKNPDVIIIGAWNFAKNIIKVHRKFVDDGGIFIIPLPDIEEINKDNIDEYLRDK